MTLRIALLASLILATPPTHAQISSLTLPADTPLAVYLQDHLPMKVGQPIRAELIYPVYAGETQVLPEWTVLQGTVVALTPDSKRRLRARLRGDFTPFRIPVVHFTSVVLADGTSAPISIGAVADGAPYLRIAPPPPRTGGLVKRSVAQAKEAVRTQVKVFTAPGKVDRLVQTLYSNLPYHPQRVEQSTAWRFETTSEFALPPASRPLTSPPPDLPVKVAEAPLPTWVLQAFLTEPLNSATSHTGQTIHAVVARPVFNEDKTVAVPVGSILTGTVVNAKPARSFGRNGALRFAFNQLTLPEGATRNVQTTITGVDSQRQIAMDSEGQFKPQSNNSVVVPLILAVLATRALHTERDGRGSEQLGKNTTGANGFGLIGSILGAAAQSPQLAAGIGYYGTALTLIDRFIAHGKQVAFAHNTRVIVETTARRSAPLKPETAAK
jgi:hypothetical protein